VGAKLASKSKEKEVNSVFILKIKINQTSNSNPFP
jgi:hypothetical protein